jgi:hypothetical protein
VTRTIVTLAGCGALVVAVLVVVRFRDTRRTLPDPLPDGAGFASRVAQSVGRATGMVAAALVSGFLVLGLGGRLMMRLLAVTSGSSAQGLITDADEIVGEVTVGGTIGFVLFIGGFGGLVSLGIYVILRRWFPPRSLYAGLVAAGIGGGLFARLSGLVDPDNFDFVILSPTWFAVLFALALIVIYGLVFATLVDRWAVTWPRPSPSLKGIAALLPLVMILPLAGFAAIVFLAIASSVFVGPKLRESALLATTDTVGLGVVVVLGLVGAAWTLVGAFEVLTL